MRIRALIAVATAAASAVIGLTATTTAATPAAGQTADRIAVNRTLDLGRLGQTIQSDTKDFAGLSINEKTHALTVYTATGGAAVAKARTELAAQHNASPALAGWENKALAATTGYTILYKPVAHSQAELTALADKLSAHKLVDGVKWRTVATYPKLNKVVLGVTHPTAALRAQLAKQYGDMVKLIQADPQPAVLHQKVHLKPGMTPNNTQAGASRGWDQPYWKGGAQIKHWDNLGNGWWKITTCTAGFGWTDPYYAPTQMMTAGHCGPSGWSWFSGSNSDNSRRVGITGWQTFNAGNTDAALITEVDGQGIAPEIYNGGPSSNTYWPVGGTGYNWAGGQLCSDGSVTGENCSGVIDSCDVKADYGSAGVAYHMCGTDTSNGSRLTNHGDSGGPVVSGNMLQHGIISGEANDAGTYMYFTPWIAVTNMIGGHSCPC